MYAVEYTCEQSDTRQTITNITAASPSTFIPISSFKLPASRYGIDAWTGAWPAAICPNTIVDITRDADVATIPTSAPLPGRRPPKKRMTKKAAAGSDGTNQA